MLYDFDTTATSPVLPEVGEDYARRLAQAANNPSSAHGGGLEAAGLLDQARFRIGQVLDCQAGEVFFTSGGTESINLALKGVAWSIGRRPKRMVTSAGEHEAVLASLDFIKRHEGFEIEILPLLAQGMVDQAALLKSLEAQAPGLVSLMAVSNETGAINDLGTLVPLIRSLAPQALVHSDLVQAGGKFPFSFKKSGLDLASFSGHKLGAPKQTGLLIKRKGLTLTPLHHGGGQQEGLRSGTVDVPGALALAQALDIHQQRMEANLAKVKALRQVFLEALEAGPTPHKILSPPEASPYVLALALPGLRGETLMHALSAESIYVSTGSACSSKKAGENHVLAAMGLDKSSILSAVRISFQPDHEPDHVRHLAQRIQALYARYALK